MKTLEASKYKQRGFTIIELVIVILVIGILSAVALPRMIDLSSQARKSVAIAIGGNFSTAVELLRGQWIGQNKPYGVESIDGKVFFIDITGTGAVKNVSATTPANAVTASDGISQAAVTDVDCVSLWNNLLKSPPIAKATSVSANCRIDGTCKFEVDKDTTNAATTGSLCTYTDKDGNIISYNRLSGYVSVKDSGGNELFAN